ncbi:MAG: NADH-quinone oxidoreductase subunit J [Bacteroidales bacterium]|nr:NADH-quinone oxidoreductase subunit J [Bacteroidales bacterium]
MNVLFIVSSVVAVIASAMAITRRNAVHALLFLIVSLMGVSMMMYTIGAPYAAVLEIIVYAGAIMMLFVFTVMMLNLSVSPEDEKRQTGFKTWIFPMVLGAILLGVMFLSFLSNPSWSGLQQTISPKQVGTLMFSRYLLPVQIAGVLLLAAIVGAYYLGRTRKRNLHRYLQNTEEE